MIFLFSTEYFSSSNTAPLFEPSLSWLFRHFSAEQLAIVQFAIRKLGHLVAYFILAILLYRALQLTDGRGPAGNAAWTLALVLICASVDEYHQTLLPSRSGSIYDVMLDGFGGVLGILWMHRRRKRAEALFPARTVHFQQARQRQKNLTTKG